MKDNQSQSGNRSSIAEQEKTDRDLREEQKMKNREEDTESSDDASKSEHAKYGEESGA